MLLLINWQSCRKNVMVSWANWRITWRTPWRRKTLTGWVITWAQKYSKQCWILSRTSAVWKLLSTTRSWTLRYSWCRTIMIGSCLRLIRTLETIWTTLLIKIKISLVLSWKTLSLSEGRNFTWISTLRSMAGRLRNVTPSNEPQQLLATKRTWLNL